MAKLSDQQKLLAFENALAKHMGIEEAPEEFKNKPVLNELLYQQKGTSLEEYVFTYDLALSNIRKATNQSGRIASQRRKAFQSRLLDEGHDNYTMIDIVQLVANLGAKGQGYTVVGTNDDAEYGGYDNSKIWFAGNGKPERVEFWTYAGYRFERLLSPVQMAHIKE